MVIIFSMGPRKNVSFYEGLVPLLVFTENEYFLEKFRLGAQKNLNKASHFNIFPTLLDIWGYKKTEYNQFHGVSLFDNITFPRKFLSGIMTVKVIKSGIWQWNAIPDSVIAR